MCGKLDRVIVVALVDNITAILDVIGDDLTTSALLLRLEELSIRALLVVCLPEIALSSDGNGMVRRTPLFDVPKMPPQIRAVIVEIIDFVVILTIDFVTLTPVESRNDAIVVSVFV